MSGAKPLVEPAAARCPDNESTANTASGDLPAEMGIIRLMPEA